MSNNTLSRKQMFLNIATSISYCYCHNRLKEILSCFEERGPSSCTAAAPWLTTAGLTAAASRVFLFEAFSPPHPSLVNLCSAELRDIIDKKMLWEDLYQINSLWPLQFQLGHPTANFWHCKSASQPKAEPCTDLTRTLICTHECIYALSWPRAKSLQSYH